MTKIVRVKNVVIGGGNRIAVQSMTNTKTEDVSGTLAQIERLKAAGCDIVRCTVNTEEAAKGIAEIVKGTDMPVVADIHFDYRLALASVRAGVHKIRFNPGNIGDFGKVEILASAAKDAGVPIRVGVNSGSIERDLLEKYGNTTEALVESALRHVALLEKCGFYDTVISAKASNPEKTVEAYRLLSKKVDYPLHVGVTEAGYGKLAEYKSVSAMGSLLLDGIGDTIRISITGDPVKEVEAGITLLRAVGKDKDFVNIISCPTCGRTEIPLEKIVSELTERTKNIKKRLTVAVMGCVVNGIGESSDCDIGIAGGKGKSALFKDGKILKTVDNADIIPELMAFIESK